MLCSISLLFTSDYDETNKKIESQRALTYFYLEVHAYKRIGFNLSFNWQQLVNFNLVDAYQDFYFCQ